MRKLWHSKDGGRSWEEIEVKDTSLLGFMQFKPGTDYDDGYGNIYRETKPDGE